VWNGARRSWSDTRSEPLPFADFYIARARALLAWRRGLPDLAELAHLRDEGERLGLLVALPAINTAIGELHG
jgi:hypothetical protein